MKTYVRGNIFFTIAFSFGILVLLTVPARAQSTTGKKPATAPKAQPKKVQPKAEPQVTPKAEPQQATPIAEPQPVAPRAEPQKVPSKFEPNAQARAMEETPPSALPSAVTLALRAGYNMPSSRLSAGFFPDVELGYRIGMDGFAIEPAFGFQRFGGDAMGRVTSSQFGEGSSLYEQTVSANVYEGRLRGWFDLGAAGSPLLGVNLGAISAEAEQESFSVTREEADSSITWGAHAGWAYPIPAAFGNVELLVGYRQAAVDFVTTGNENLSGVQVLAGWHAAF